MQEQRQTPLTISIRFEDTPNWKTLLAGDEPPSDAIGVDMFVEEDGNKYAVTDLLQKTDGKVMRTRVVAKFWLEFLEEYDPPGEE